MANIAALIEAQPTLFHLKKVTDQILQSMLFNFDVKPAEEIVCAFASEEVDEDDDACISVLCEKKAGKKAEKKAENTEKKVWKNKYAAKQDKKEATQSAIRNIVLESSRENENNAIIQVNLLNNEKKQKPTKQERKRNDKKRHNDRAAKQQSMHL